MGFVTRLAVNHLKLVGAEKIRDFKFGPKKTFGFSRFHHVSCEISKISSWAVVVDRRGSPSKNLRNFSSFFSGQHGKMDKDEKNPKDV